MNKNILIGIAAFGGLILIATLLPKTPNTTEVFEAEIQTNPTLTTEVTSRFPIYPDTKTISTNKSTAEDGKVSYSFSLKTSDSIQEVNDWYREALASGGWSIKSDKNIGGYQIIQGENNNLYTSMQATGGENETVTISQQTQIRP